MQDLKARTKQFDLDVIRVCRSLPQGDEFWLEDLAELNPVENPELKRLLRESDELVAIAVASRKTART